MKKCLSLHILCMTLLFALGFSGCRSECNPYDNSMKCDGNTLMVCLGTRTGEWVEQMNCDDFGAVCTNANITFRDLYHPTAQDPLIYSHGCVVDSVHCGGDTDYQCAEDHSYIAACSYDPKPAAVIIEENQFNHPYCIEKSDGTASFGYAEDECLENESQCVGDDAAMRCDNGVWMEYVVEGYCLYFEQNLACRTLLKVGIDTAYIGDTEQDTDSSTEIVTVTYEGEGVRTAQCVNADPCNAQTGEYDICAPEISSRAEYQCSNRSTGDWAWSPVNCPTSSICVTQPDGSGVCEY